MGNSHHGTFWGVENILYLDLDGGYRVHIIIKKSTLQYVLRLLQFMCFIEYSESENRSVVSDSATPWTMEFSRPE